MNRGIGFWIGLILVILTILDYLDLTFFPVFGLVFSIVALVAGIMLIIRG
jgi:hypothetical protein